MSSANTITLVGHLGRDPQLSYTPKGTPYARFSIATTERKPKDKNPLTTWFHVTAWGPQALFVAEHFSSGQPAYVVGTLSRRDYVDRDSRPAVSLDVRAYDIAFAPSNRDAVAPAAASDAPRGTHRESSPPAGRPTADDSDDFGDLAPALEDDLADVAS